MKSERLNVMKVINDVYKMMLHHMLCSLVLVQIAAFSPSWRHRFELHALGAVKTALTEPAASSRLKRTKGFVDWAKESGIK